MQAKGGPPIPRLRYTFEQLANVRRFHGCTMSSDCKQAAIIADLDGQMNLWLVPAAGGFPVQLTFFKDQTVRDVQWAPVANQIAFQADSQGNELHQLYLLDKDGKAAATLGVSPDGVPWVFLFDKDQKAGAILDVSADGTVNLRLNDKDGKPRDAITVLIKENPPENVGVGREPLTETYQENPIALGRQRWRRIVSC